MIKLIECPRDAMQGIKEFIPTSRKVEYINALLRVGFDTIDFGSFVSPKAVPQMQDTSEVLASLDLEGSKSKLLAIIANQRGAEDAVQYPQIHYLGYPFSVSETFQLRNTNATIAESLERVRDIVSLCRQYHKTPVMYLSMGFGNPYGDAWNADIVSRWVEVLAGMGIQIMSMSDTIGVSTPESISYLFSNIIPRYPEIEFGAHLHTHPRSWEEKVKAAYENGCRRFDGALKGFGGCPMAKDELVGNMPTENMLYYFDAHDIPVGIDRKAFNTCLQMAGQVFPGHESN